MRDNLALSPDRMLYKDYDRKGLVIKKCLVVGLKRLGAKMN
jgi:hypothetical protein